MRSKSSCGSLQTNHHVVTCCKCYEILRAGSREALSCRKEVLWFGHDRESLALGTTDVIYGGMGSLRMLSRAGDQGRVGTAGLHCLAISALDTKA